MKKFAAAIFALGMWICAQSMIAAPDQVLQYWPKQPGEISLPSKVYFASKNIQNADQALQEDDQSAQLVQGADLIIDFGSDVGGFFEFKVKLDKPAEDQIELFRGGQVRQIRRWRHGHCLFHAQPAGKKIHD